MHGSGCENCHGPGSAHVAAENGDIDVTPEQRQKLIESMRLPLAEAERRCMDCHDHDNSPDFHVKGAFEKYWEKVKHEGKD
jgi:ribosome maturation protein Sdo1